MLVNVNGKSLVDHIYPIGSIYFSTVDENPSKYFGGTWTTWGSGRVPVGVDTSDSDFKTAEKTGGEKEHTLTVDEMPRHNHTISNRLAGSQSLPGDYGAYLLAGTDNSWVKDTGGDQPHNNLQPYITCYMWKRTA